jgi:hypothetical protein
MPRGPTLKDRLDKPTLSRLYESCDVPAHAIAERFGATPGEISKLMKDYGIPRRTLRGRNG